EPGSPCAVGTLSGFCRLARPSFYYCCKQESFRERRRPPALCSEGKTNMKFSIEKGEFQRGLGRIQSIVEKRNTMPILANALLEVTGKKEGSLELAATDLEVGIRSSHPCEVAKPGRLTVSARKLHEIV